MYVTHNNTRKFSENVSGRLEIYQRKNSIFKLMDTSHAELDRYTYCLKNVSLSYAVSLPKSQENLVRVLYRVSK